MKQKCMSNHNPNNIENSLKMLKKRHMDNPSVYYFICDDCNAILTFIKDKEGAFVEVK